LATEISERYFGRDLPHKFKFGVTGCQNNCLKAEGNDLGVKGGCSIRWEQASCVLCGICVKTCRAGALSVSAGCIVQDQEKCRHCGRCVKSCPTKAWKGKPGYILSFGGTFGNRIVAGSEVFPMVKDKKTLFRVADAALDFFEEHAKPGERFRFAIDRTGWGVFKAAMSKAYGRSKVL
jgi:dissimilatory sulfite reductase (desulfoviridin) alpha/beta subunit